MRTPDCWIALLKGVIWGPNSDPLPFATLPSSTPSSWFVPVKVQKGKRLEGPWKISSGQAQNGVQHFCSPSYGKKAATWVNLPTHISSQKQVHCLSHAFAYCVDFSLDTSYVPNISITPSVAFTVSSLSASLLLTSLFSVSSHHLSLHSQI